MDGTFPCEGRVKKPKNRGGRVIHQPDGRTRDADEYVHGASHRKRNPLCSLQCKRLGDEFPKQHFEISNKGERYDDCDGVSINERTYWRSREPTRGELQDDISKGRFSNPPQCKTCL